MSNIEKALKKFRDESKKGAGKVVSEAVPEADLLRQTDLRPQEPPHAIPDKPSGHRKNSHAGTTEDTTSVRAEIPAKKEVDNFSQRSTSNDDAVNGYLAEHVSRSLKDQEVSRIESNTLLDSLPEHDTHDQPTPVNEIAPLTQETTSDVGQSTLRQPTGVLNPTLPASLQTKANWWSKFIRTEQIAYGIHTAMQLPSFVAGLFKKDEEENFPKLVVEDKIPSTKTGAYGVDEHIVSYYDSINEQTWEGPVMVHFRRLQVSLASIQKNNECKVMLFTSSTQKEGKSTISTNTAITLCSDKKSKIVIVDCDFRKPTVNKLLGFEPDTGLSDYLAEKAEIKDITIDGFVPGLTIIPVGNKPPNTCELFASDRMQQFISYLRERFDYVIIDTPPVLAFPDTSILAPLSDGVVFVINCKKMKKSIVKRAVETLHDCKIMGFVMNQSESAAVDYYGYTSGYAYYDYGSS